MSEEKEEKSERDLIMEELLAEHPILEIVSFNEFNLEEKIREHPYMLVKYRELASKEKYALDQINDIMDRVKGEAYHHYRFEMDESLRQNEIEQYYIPRDPKVLKVKQALMKQKIRVDFFETCAKAIEKCGWAHKNYMESMRIN